MSPASTANKGAVRAHVPALCSMHTRRRRARDTGEAARGAPAEQSKHPCAPASRLNGSPAAQQGRMRQALRAVHRPWGSPSGSSGGVAHQSTCFLIRLDPLKAVRQGWAPRWGQPTCRGGAEGADSSRCAPWAHQAVARLSAEVLAGVWKLLRAVPKRKRNVATLLWPSGCSWCGLVRAVW